MKTPNRLELDVRQQLRSKLEPFELIMDTVKKLGKEDTFILHTIFKPTPLLGVLKLKGFANRVDKLESDHWVTTFVHKSRKHQLETGQASVSPDGEADADKQAEPGHACGSDAQEASNAEPGVTYTLDNRGLEPPQPMMRTLGQLEKMASGDMLVILNDRVPVFLIEELNALGCTYEVTELADGTARIIIRKP